MTYSAHVRDVPAGAREVILWLPFPPSNESQETSNITVRSDVPTSVNREEEFGNQVLSLKVLDPGRLFGSAETSREARVFFGAFDEDCVAFSVGRDIRLNPPQQGERLNYFVYPYAEIDGRPHEKFDRQIRFENSRVE
jgi:hypothetical protein